MSGGCLGICRVSRFLGGFWVSEGIQMSRRYLGSGKGCWVSGSFLGVWGMSRGVKVPAGVSGYLRGIWVSGGLHYLFSSDSRLSLHSLFTKQRSMSPTPP